MHSLGRGFAWFAIAAAGLMLAGALWPLTGDDQGALASVGLSGLGLCGVWVLAVGVSLLRRDRSQTGTHEVVDLEQPG
jgi:hypothetical protein